MSSRPGARLLTAAALVAAAGALSAAPAAGSEVRGGGPHKDAAEGAPLDLVEASLAQRGRDLLVTLRAARSIDPDELAAGGRVCWTADAAAGPSAVCARREGNRWALSASGRPVAGSVARPRPGTLQLRFRPAAAGLRPGPLRWHVAATAASCAATRSQAPGGTAPGGGTEPDAAPDCTDRVPDAGDRPGRVWRALATGCEATGPAQVTRGPQGSGRVVALTYDDGPAGLTPAFLRELERLAVPATFFMIGRQVAAEAPLLRRMLAAGHELANHSWDHANLGGGGPGATSQLERTNAAIRRATGFTPCLFRPPYGATGGDLVARTRALGMTSVLWSADPNDWRTPGSGAIVQRVLAQAGPGGIILSHDGGGPRSQTLAALPQIVRSLRERGYRFVTVSALLGYRERVELRR